MHAISMILTESNAHDREAVAATLGRLPVHLLALAAENGMRIRILEARQRYSDVSAVLRKLGNRGVDCWPIPPVGLFVVEERMVYLRSTSPMSVAHETFHAIDCALGGGNYLSLSDSRIRYAFEHASAFVTPYAGSGLDEYFAESCRAMTGINDVASLWPRVSPTRLKTLDPLMFGYLSELFAVPTTRDTSDSPGDTNVI